MFDAFRSIRRRGDLGTITLMFFEQSDWSLTGT